MNQNRNTISALDYSIATLQNIKKTLCNYGDPHHDTNWAVGAVLSNLTANLLKIMHEVIFDQDKTQPAKSTDDLKEIMDKFNLYLNDLIEVNLN